MTVVLVVVIVLLVAALAGVLLSRQRLVEQLRGRAVPAPVLPAAPVVAPPAPTGSRQPVPGGPRPLQGPPTAPGHEVETGVSTPPQGFRAQVPPEAALTPPEGIPAQGRP